jgi:hypothetical protein
MYKFNFPFSFTENFLTSDQIIFQRSIIKALKDFKGENKNVRMLDTDEVIEVDAIKASFLILQNLAVLVE